jgi:hypothetical protein
MIALVSVLRPRAVIGVVFALTLSGAVAGEVPHSLPNGLQRAENSLCRHAHSKDGTDWSKYKTIHLKPLEVPVEVRDATGRRSRTRESYVLGDRDVAALKDSFAKTFRNAFGDAGFTFVDKPEANTLIISPGLLDITLGAPGERAPVSYGGRGRVSSRGGGSLTMAAVLADGSTGEVRAEVAGHRYPAGIWRENNATNLSDARMVFGVWSRELRDKLAPSK